MLLPEYWGLGIASKVATILVEQPADPLKYLASLRFTILQIWHQKRS